VTVGGELALPSHFQTWGRPCRWGRGVEGSRFPVWSVRPECHLSDGDEEVRTTLG
jgi:hypothetical protein